MRTSPPPPDWASPDSWSPTKSSMRSPAQAPCSRKNNWRLRSQRLSDSSRRMMMAPLTVLVRRLGLLSWLTMEGLLPPVGMGL